MYKRTHTGVHQPARQRELAHGPTGEQVHHLHRALHCRAQQQEGGQLGGAQKRDTRGQCQPLQNLHRRKRAEHQGPGRLGGHAKDDADPEMYIIKV